MVLYLPTDPCLFSELHPCLPELALTAALASTHKELTTEWGPNWFSIWTVVVFMYPEERFLDVLLLGAHVWVDFLLSEVSRNSVPLMPFDTLTFPFPDFPLPSHGGLREIPVFPACVVPWKSQDN